MSDSSAHTALFSQIPEEVLYSDISDGAYRLYGALARIVDSRERVGFVLIKTLAKRLNRSESAVKRHMKELTAAGLVVSQQQWVDEHGEYHTHQRPGWRQTANVYTLPMDVKRGSKSEPPTKGIPAPGIKNEPPGGAKSEPTPGSRNDLQYESPSIPEPNNPISPAKRDRLLGPDDFAAEGEEKEDDELASKRIIEEIKASLAASRKAS